MNYGSSSDLKLKVHAPLSRRTVEMEENNKEETKVEMDFSWVELVLRGFLRSLVEEQEKGPADENKRAS